MTQEKSLLLKDLCARLLETGYIKIVLLRFIVVWVALHIILFFVERYRFKHNNRSWYAFKMDGMLNITYYVLTIDKAGITIAIVGGIVYWILQPIIDM